MRGKGGKGRGGEGKTRQRPLSLVLVLVLFPTYACYLLTWESLDEWTVYDDDGICVQHYFISTIGTTI